MKIGAAALTAVLALALTACGGPSPTTTSAPPSTTAPAPPTTEATAPDGADLGATGGEKGKYPAAMRDSFLSSCSNEADRAQCECALKYLEKNVDLTELIQAGVKSTKGKMPKVLADAVAACT
jgi:hypothetical protein